MTYVDDVPDEIVERLRDMLLALPDVHEQTAWKGTRWRVRNTTFASVIAIDFEDDGRRRVVVAFHSSGEEYEVLCRAGPPFLVLGWGRKALGMVLDGDTDWDEVRELLTESYCVRAPKKLAAQVERPPEPA